MSGVVARCIDDGILTATFQHPASLNSMSHALELAIIDLCNDVAGDASVKAVVFTGGPGRSFCAGGDFNEVSAMTTAAEVDAWIDRLLALYVAVLRLDKPTIAAIDGYAIGIGFQLALACDLRLATPAARIIMWELKHGVACTIGSYMLQAFLGRAAMLDLVYTCEPVDLEWGVATRLLTRVVAAETLLAEAHGLASRLAAYPELSWRLTKQALNRDFIDGLLAIGPVSRQAHRAGFAARLAAPHFDRVLRRETITG